MKEDFDKFFNELFPDYVEGSYYDFSDGKVSAADAERYREVGRLVEESLSDTTVEISNKVYHFL